MVKKTISWIGKIIQSDEDLVKLRNSNYLEYLWEVQKIFIKKKEDEKNDRDWIRSDGKSSCSEGNMPEVRF